MLIRIIISLSGLVWIQAVCKGYQQAIKVGKESTLQSIGLIYCLMYFPLFMGVLCLSLFCYALLCVHSSFAVILKRKRKLVALLLLSYGCLVTVNVL